MTRPKLVSSQTSLVDAWAVYTVLRTPAAPGWRSMRLPAGDVCLNVDKWGSVTVSITPPPAGYVTANTAGVAGSILAALAADFLKTEFYPPLLDYLLESGDSRVVQTLTAAMTLPPDEREM